MHNQKNFFEKEPCCFHEAMCEFKISQNAISAGFEPDFPDFPIFPDFEFSLVKRPSASLKKPLENFLSNYKCLINLNKV